MEWNGSGIKELAKAKGLKLNQLADEIGVSRQSVSDWIKGQIPKGIHLVNLCRILEVTPNVFFDVSDEPPITVPAHRKKANAKVTPERQQYALELAKEYSTFFKNITEPRIVPVIRAKDRSDSSARAVAAELRKIAGSSGQDPITQEETFRLMKRLGIHVIVRRFPDTIKAYAFYTKIHSYRAVFVDYNTNVIDLNFALLHEAIHAVRDEEVVSASYDNEEETFCDLVANYIQFPDEYVEFAHNTVASLSNRGQQVNLLKRLGEKNLHALFGLSKRIKQVDSSFTLNVGGADTVFKRQFRSLGDALFSEDDAGDYLDTLHFVSPIFVNAVLSQYEGMSDRRLGELLGVDHILDAKEVRTELNKRHKQRDK